MSKTLLEIIDLTGCPNPLGNPNNLGGARKSAGRKKGEPKKAIGKRVPERYHSQLVKFLETELQRLLELERQNGL